MYGFILTSQVIPIYAMDATEDSIEKHSFDLVFAFDEVLIYGGHRETISLNQIDVNIVLLSIDLYRKWKVKKKNFN